MVNIIYPKYTSKDLRKFWTTAMNQLGEKTFRKLSRTNTFYNVLGMLFFWVIAICLMSLAIRFIDVPVLGVVLILLSSSVAILAFSWIGDIRNETITTSRMFSQFKENGCDHPRVLEKDFLKVILEAERIEAFCDIIKNHPDCILQETDNWDVKVEYIENNFKKTKTFSPSFDLYRGKIIKDFVLDFSYLDKRADKYLNNSND